MVLSCWLESSFKGVKVLSEMSQKDNKKRYYFHAGRRVKDLSRCWLLCYEVLVESLMRLGANVSVDVAGHKNHLQVTSSGAIRRLDLAGLSMLQYPASELEAGLCNLYLRRYGAGPVAVAALFGPGSKTRVRECTDGVSVQGAALGMSYEVRVTFASSIDAWFVHAWLWADESVDCDLVWIQDPALVPYATVRTNEYYVCQYLDVTPVTVFDRGVALAVRQNMPGPRNPWVLFGGLTSVVGWATDARQLVGRQNGRPTLTGLYDVLPNKRLQHEHTLVALSTERLRVEPGVATRSGFFGLLQMDHPEATDDADAAWATVALELPESRWPDTVRPDPSIFDAVCSLFDSPAMVVDHLSNDEISKLFPGVRLHEEFLTTDRLGSFVCANSGQHVALAAKEELVLRPHGHILRSGGSLTPDTGVLTSTVWMAGVFASQVTQGHVSRNVMISARRTYLGLQEAHGLRIFVKHGGVWRILEIPSAWSIAPDSVRWVYASQGLEIDIIATAANQENELSLAIRVSRGQVEQILVALECALGGDDGLTPCQVSVAHDGTISVGDQRFRIASSVRPDRFAGDEILFSDHRYHGTSWVAFVWDQPVALDLTLTASLVPDGERCEPMTRDSHLWLRLQEALQLEAQGAELSDDVSKIASIVPFFQHNALVHYLSPRGIEQYTGGGWGTRDVCQGPIGLLTAIGAPQELRQVLLLVFGAQNERGDWPQAFSFLPSESPVRGQADSHGDVIYWPLLALGEYLQSTTDSTILGETVPMVTDMGISAGRLIIEHVGRAVDRISQTGVPGVHLPAYGHGDWNDSLQPADPQLAQQMVSTWTAVLQVYALNQLSMGLDSVGAAPELADRCRAMSAKTREAVREHLLVDGILAGYGVFDSSAVRLLVHPRDYETGLKYSILPWIHAITYDILTPDEANHHLQLLHEHLLCPDGVHLFDQPAPYRGGPMKVFQRAEAATFWGREIGLMYMHAHLRYAEALARVGDGIRLWEALQLSHPLGLADRVSQARPRQTSCYFSSSDAAFADRYEAKERYHDIKQGIVEFEGGWRIYSSGPGLFLRILVECALGVRTRSGRLEIDPVLPPGVDGLTAHLRVLDRPVTVCYHMKGSARRVMTINVDGRPIHATRLDNPYRVGGLSIDLRELSSKTEIPVLDITCSD